MINKKDIKCILLDILKNTGGLLLVGTLVLLQSGLWAAFLILTAVLLLGGQ